MAIEPGTPAPRRSNRNRNIAIGCGGALLLTCVCIGLAAALGGRNNATVATTAAASATTAPTVVAKQAVAATVAPAPTSPPAAKATEPPRETSTPRPPTVTATPAPPTNTPSADDQLAGIARGQFRDRFKTAKLSVINFSDLARLAEGEESPEGQEPKPGDDVQTFATVDYVLGAQWDEGTTVRTVATDLKQLAPKVFQETDADALELRAYTDFKDVRGNTRESVAMKFTVTRATADKVNWANVDVRNVGRVLDGEYDGVYVHPALRPAWATFQAGR